MSERTPLFSIEIPGRPVIKKNTKKVIRRYGQTRVIYSKLFLEWEKNALFIIKQAWRKPAIDVPLEIKLHFFFEDRRSEADVSNLCEAPQDVLQKAEVIKDDRLIQIVSAQKSFHETARTKIELFEI